MKALMFTEWQPSEKDCLGWYDWFRERGIPTAIISNDDGTKFAVLRQGVITKTTEKGMKTVTLPLKRIANGFKVIRSCNEFVADK